MANKLVQVLKVYPSTSAGVNSERRIATGTALSLKFLDVFVETSLVRGVAAR